MAKYPHKNYILSRLLMQHPIKAINSECNSYSFDVPDAATIVEYTKLLSKEFDKANPDFDYLLDLDIYHLVCYYLEDSGELFTNLPMPVMGIEGALRIVEDPHMRRLITTMSLCNIQDEDIELMVNARYNYNYAPEDVRMFVHYFADFSKFKFAEKEAYINGIQDKTLRKQYSYALKGDKNLLLWKLGLAPDKSFDSMLRDIGNDCFYNYQEQISLNDPSEAQKWVGLLLKVQERLDKIDGEDTDKKDLFGSLVFQVQAMKADKSIMAPEDVQLELPTYVTSDEGRKDIISLSDLESLSNQTALAIEEKVDKQDEKRDEE